MLSKITNLKKKLYQRKNKVYLFFTIFKYIEYFVLAMIYLFFAKKVNPYEYGLASIGFQTITYSSFLALGINPILIKWYTLEKRLRFKRFYIQYNAFFNLIVSIIVFAIVVLFLNREYKIWVATICALKIIQESSVNINRIKNRFYFINITYLSFVLLFGVLFMVFSNNANTFFFCWAISLMISTLFGFISTILPFIRSINPVFFFNMLKGKYISLLVEGIKLSSLSIVTPFIATSGLLLINTFGVDKTYVGNIQLADNIASVIALGGSSIIYIILPNIIKRFNEEPQYVFRVYKMLLKVLLILLPIFVIIQIPIYYFTKFVFVKYEFLQVFLNLSFFCRVLILFLTVPMSYFIAHSLEYTYTKIMMVASIAQIVLIIAIIKWFHKSVYVECLLISAIPILTLLIVHFLFIRNIKSKRIA